MRTSVITKQKDIAVAGLDTFREQRASPSDYTQSDVARIAVIDEYGAETNRAVAAGWIDHRTAVARGLKFSQQLQNADAMAAIQKDPAAAALRLQDPAQFPALDPVTRQSYITHAIGQAESNTTAQWVGDAHHNPVRSQMAIGRVSTPDQARNIFDAGILKVGNGTGQVDAVSSKGALGLSQILPGTARDVARGLGLNDVAALSEDDLKKRLLTDGALNVQLGRVVCFNR